MYARYATCADCIIRGQTLVHRITAKVLMKNTALTGARNGMLPCSARRYALALATTEQSTECAPTSLLHASLSLVTKQMGGRTRSGLGQRKTRRTAKTKVTPFIREPLVVVELHFEGRLPIVQNTLSAEMRKQSSPKILLLVECKCEQS